MTMRTNPVRGAEIPLRGHRSIINSRHLKCSRRRSALGFSAAPMVTICLLGFVGAAKAQIIADSISDFSGVQGESGWYYGFYGGPFAPVGFQPMPIFGCYGGGSYCDVWSRTASWPGGYWTNVGRDDVGHPNGFNGNGGTIPELNWAVRRWVSPVAGPATITARLSKQNTGGGNGVAGHLFIGNAEVWTAAIGGVDGVGVMFEYEVCLQVGTVIDLALDPINGDDARDGSYFGFRVTALPGTCSIATQPFSSSDATLTTRPITGTTVEQVAEVNTPPVGPITGAVQRQHDRHTTSSFACGDSGPPSTVTTTMGDRDGFEPGDAADVATPSAGLLAAVNGYFPGLSILDSYDLIPGTAGVGQNKIFAETISGIPAAAIDATLTLRLRAGTGGADTDLVRLGFTGGASPGARWTQEIPGWQDGSGPEIFSYDLTALPRPGDSPLNLLPYIASRGGVLNLTVDDDTGVDWIEIEYSLPGGPIDPLAQPFVNSSGFITDADEVTLDNCASAWYRHTFTLPALFEGPVLVATVNADDVAVAYLNGNRISALALAADLTNGGLDRNAEGQALLNRPTPDALLTSVTAHFVAGENELVFGVLKGATSPTGIEFEGTVTYREVRLLGDMNCNGVVNVADIAGFVLALTNPAGYAAQFPDCDLENADANQNGVVNVADIGAFVALLTGS